MSTDTQTCDITLPGYTLVERIGSGGYAEVWRAEAPGGLQKAVKVVYGFYDDEFASQELKALERVKGVRHPFLLSLERFEIINGRLAILTELADLSLDQRMRQCRAEGLTGIPREELVRYMADAAEALDFLAQKHSLLHLDIKPENLLVLGDHIKVADFGLVKELASRTQNSLVSGMTPTYASPEMFDDDPSAHSDQYSLAIVYQEMLVGTLPFPGRTAAQLAKQHTQAEPQLLSLPAEDRPVIARALAKRPEDRFPSCRAFVDALRGIAAAPVATPAAVFGRAAAPPPDETRPPSHNATLPRQAGQAIEQIDHAGPSQAPPAHNATQPVQRAMPVTPTAPTRTLTRAALPLAAPARAPAPFVPEEATDIPTPEINAELSRAQATLYVGLGGVGIQVLGRLRTLAGSANDRSRCCEAVALDTSRDELREATSSRWSQPLAPEDALHLPLRLPKSYDNAREILGWVSRRWLYNIPRSLETRGFRPLGRVALVDHGKKVLALLDQKLELLAAVNAAAAAANAPHDPAIRVVLIAGMGGGTGAGMTLDVANAVRTLAAERQLTIEVDACLVCTCLATTNSSPLVAANTYALLTELAHAAETGNCANGEAAAVASPFESSGSPFDHIYCVPTRARSGNSESTDSLNQVARFLTLENRPEARAALRSCRATPSPREQRAGLLTLRKFGFASLADRQQETLNELATELAQAIKQHWLAEDRSADWARLVRQEQLAASLPTLTAPEDNPAAGPLVAPPNDSSPLALRGRFQDELALVFTTEVIAEIQRQLAARDDRGRPLLVPKEAKQIADAARVAAATLRRQVPPDASAGARFAASNVLRPLISAASQRMLLLAIQKFDVRQPERFLSIDQLDDWLQRECRVLLAECQSHPDIAHALAGLVAVEAAIERTLDEATTELLKCGVDRRTLVLVPRDQVSGPAVEKLRALRPLASIVPAEVDELLIISEESGLSPQSLARGLEHVFPGVAEAGRRLLTRVDIEWKPLG